MPVSLDLEKAWKHQKHGDLIVVLTWVNDERSLVLLPAHRRNAGWYIVQESAAYRWGVDHSEPAVRRESMEHAMEQAAIACDVLNLEPSRMSVARVISIITGWIPDLYRMPSAPEQEFDPEAYGHMILRADGKEIAGQDLRTEVVGGASYG